MTIILNLSDEVVHRIFSYLPPKTRIILSHTCRALRKAATSLPAKYKDLIILTLENELCTSTYGFMFIPVHKMNSMNNEFLEQRKINSENTPLEPEELQQLEVFNMKRRFNTSSRVIDVLSPLFSVATFDKFRILTTISDLVGKDWFRICEAVAARAGASLKLLALDLISVRRPTENIRYVPEELLPHLDVVCHVCLVFILWNVARLGIPSFYLRYSLPLSVLTSVRMNWFSHLDLSFMAIPEEVTKKALGKFESFIRRFLAGNYGDTTFSFTFMIGGYVGRVKKEVPPFETELHRICADLGQLNRVCHHMEDGHISVYHTINEGKHRISWQGPTHAEERGFYFIHVLGKLDSDQAIPRTRQLTPAILKQMERSMLYTLEA